jgi:hypothetical protein
MGLFTITHHGGSCKCRNGYSVRLIDPRNTIGEKRTMNRTSIFAN